MSSICRYQIVVDYTSITVYKPTLQAINLSPVTPLPVSDEEDKNSIISCKLRPLYMLVCSTTDSGTSFNFWVKTKFLEFTGVLKTIARKGLFMLSGKSLQQTQTKKLDLTSGLVVLDIHERAEGGVSSARLRVHVAVMTSTLFGLRELRLHLPLLQYC